MRKALTIGTLLLLLAGSVQAEMHIQTQPLGFTELATSGYRIAYAIIEVPGWEAGALKGADLQFTAACSNALGKLTLASTSLWEELPTDWELALEPANGMTGLFFPADGERVFHAEIGKLLMDWPGPQSAFLVAAVECGDIDCACTPLIASAQLQLSVLDEEGQ